MQLNQNYNSKLTYHKGCRSYFMHKTKYSVWPKPASAILPKIQGQTQLGSAALNMPE